MSTITITFTLARASVLKEATKAKINAVVREAVGILAVFVTISAIVAMSVLPWVN